MTNVESNLYFSPELSKARKFMFSSEHYRFKFRKTGRCAPVPQLPTEGKINHRCGFSVALQEHKNIFLGQFISYPLFANPFGNTWFSGPGPWNKGLKGKTFFSPPSFERDLLLSNWFISSAVRWAGGRERGAWVTTLVRPFWLSGP